MQSPFNPKTDSNKTGIFKCALGRNTPSAQPGRRGIQSAQLAKEHRSGRVQDPRRCYNMTDFHYSVVIGLIVLMVAVTSGGRVLVSSVGVVVVVVKSSVVVVGGRVLVVVPQIQSLIGWIHP